MASRTSPFSTPSFPVIPNPELPAGGIVILQPRSFILVEGGDRVRFLNGQVTNDMRKTEAGSCLYTAVLNAKGQLDAVCHVRAVGEAFLIDAPAGLGETLLERLDRYLIADDVTLTDVSDQWHLVHAFGPLPELPLPPDAILHQCERFGGAGTDVLSREPWSLPEEELIGPDEVEALRIRNGVPAWPAELQPGLLPPEAGLDRTAISYDKGCYLGQEVISRMKRAGKTNRHLVQLEVPAGTEPGLLLADGAEAGEVTSVAPGAPAGSTTLALGYRKRKLEDQNTFQTGTAEAKVVQRLA